MSRVVDARHFWISHLKGLLASLLTIKPIRYHEGLRASWYLDTSWYLDIDNGPLFASPIYRVIKREGDSSGRHSTSP
jgi:hypothetical protein